MTHSSASLASVVDDGFGFPVVFVDVPVVMVRGRRVPDIDWNAATLAVLAALVDKAGRLTGDEVRFIRLQHGLTMSAFATRFGVSHVAVRNWEARGGGPTRMQWSTEKDVRLFAALSGCRPAEFVRLYEGLAGRRSGAQEPLRVRLCDG